MGMCAGKTECEIYRNKKYCSKFMEGKNRLKGTFGS